ncbi:hypothetical protein OX284_005650 [Flavobacterium sp. SUN046]|uniref:hypothetical protein n=1 Tax=Flavobacterium sp. SUN046 TaxID=3002440 RepID=UPI002DBFA9F8|nr:hypothetical protein [Flavobacterium sp. SUN046]MEC4048902.1 hypothetical protein [Flavobacterium sp. SUN046]
MNKIILFLVFPLLISAQKNESFKIKSVNYLDSDTLYINKSKALISEIEYVIEGKYINLEVLFVVELKNYNTIFKKIIYHEMNNPYRSYNNFHIVGINYQEINATKEQLLDAIDGYRMKNNQSTFLRKNSYSTQRKKFTYQNDKKQLNELKDVYFIKNDSEVCIYFQCNR